MDSILINVNQYDMIWLNLLSVRRALAGAFCELNVLETPSLWFPDKQTDVTLKKKLVSGIGIMHQSMLKLIFLMDMFSHKLHCWAVIQIPWKNFSFIPKKRQHYLKISITVISKVTWPCNIQSFNVFSLSGMFAIRAEREYVVDEDFMKAVRKVSDNKKLETKLDYKPV